MGVSNWYSATKGFLTWPWEHVAWAIREAGSATSVLVTGSPLRQMERSDLHSTMQKPRSFSQDPTLHCPLEDFRDSLRRLALVAKGSPHDYQKNPTCWYFQDPSFCLCYPGMVFFRKRLFFPCFILNSETGNTNARIHVVLMRSRNDIKVQPGQDQVQPTNDHHQRPTDARTFILQ